MKQLSFTMAMKEFFGYKQGGTLKTFAEEIRALTMEDRIWFAKELSKEFGMTIDPERAIS